MLDYFEWILGRNSTYGRYIEVQNYVARALHLGRLSIENETMEFCIWVEELELEFFSCYTMNSVKELLDKNAERILCRSIAV